MMKYFFETRKIENRFHHTNCYTYFKSLKYPPPLPQRKHVHSRLSGCSELGRVSCWVQSLGLTTGRWISTCIHLHDQIAPWDLSLNDVGRSSKQLPFKGNLIALLLSRDSNFDRAKVILINAQALRFIGALGPLKTLYNPSRQVSHHFYR